MTDPIEALESGIYPEFAVSVYLPALPDQVFNPHYHERVFNQLQRRYRANTPEEDVLKALKRERGLILGHLGRKTVPPGAGLAVFACQPKGLLSSWALADDEVPLLAIGTKLQLAPLRRQLTQHPPALVVAASKEEARIFRVFLGELEELVSLSGHEVKRHHQGGWSAPGHQRHEDGLARVNLAVAARWLNAEPAGFYRTVHLAGPVEARTQLRELLSPAVTARLGDDLSISMYMAPGQMRERLREELRPQRDGAGQPRAALAGLTSARPA